VQSPPVGDPRKRKASLTFSVLDQRVVFDCDDPALTALLLANGPRLLNAHGPDLPLHEHYESRGAGATDAVLRYSVRVGARPRTFVVSREGGPTLAGEGGAEFLFMLEKDLTVELQRRRPDVLFLHSAALEWQGGACLLVGESGAGKSTTAWALLHHGFRYLSDELAPIDLDRMQVLPYPHALCLKSVPDHFVLPLASVDLGATLHIPPHALPAAPVDEPKALAAVFILSRSSGSGAAQALPLGGAESAARLYPHALNPLAHAQQGLDAVMRIAIGVPCFALPRAELRATCAVIRANVERLHSNGG